MSRRTVRWSESAIARRHKKRRGLGEGADYLPWLTVRDVASLGRRHRIPGLVVDRTHHLLSDLEYYVFLMLEYSGKWVDLREQYPLCRTETRSIAASISVRHPTYPYTTVPCVMTTDILLSAKAEEQHAVSVKYTNELKGKGAHRVLEKLEIERRLWDRKGVDWSLVTEKHVDMTVVRNLEWLRYLTEEATAAQMPALCGGFAAAFLESWAPGLSLSQILAAVERRQSQSHQRPTIDLFRMAVFSKVIEVDLSAGQLEAASPVVLA